MTQKKSKKLIFVITEFLLLAMLMVAVLLIIALDAVVIGHGIPENSATEYSQELLILLSSILFGTGALKYPESRGLFVLIAGLLGCMFLRELDVYLDIITRGFWFYPTFLLASVSVFYSLCCRGTVVQPLVEYSETKPVAYVAIGFLIVLLFSRIFGTGNFWREVMGFDYDSSYKSIIQEGLELVGYVLIFFGTTLLFLKKSNAEKELIESSGK